MTEDNTGLEVVQDDGGNPYWNAQGFAENIVEAVREALLVLSPDLIVLTANRSFYESFQVTPKETIGNFIYDLGNKQWDIPQLRLLLEEVLPQKSVFNGYEVDHEFLVIGRKRMLLNARQIFREKVGSHIILLAIEDITERRRAEEANGELEERLKQAQKMESVGRLAGGIAHDFNNMLGVILGHVELAMLESDALPRLLVDLKAIRQAAERSANLTRQLLTFARKQTIAPKVIDLNENVTSLVSMLKRLIGEDIHLDWHPGPDLWKVHVDSSQIDQILINLCVNARDAISGIGTITIETRNSTFDPNDRRMENQCETPGGEFVCLSVRDNGCGMDDETLSHIFEPFFTTKDLGKGTGLGLAMIYGAVKQNNGFIDVQSHPKRGTTFRIYLPPSLSVPAPMLMHKPDETGLRGIETILVVEDEQILLELTTKILEKYGYTVLAANSPGKALILAKKHPDQIRLLLTDVVMPTMNGRDLTKIVQAYCPNFRTLFMSGYTANVIVHKNVLDEGVFFIQKPFTVKDLGIKVRQILDSLGDEKTPPSAGASLGKQTIGRDTTFQPGKGSSES